MWRSLHRELNGQFFAIVISAGVILAVIGPFGTYDELSFAQRLIYFPTLCAGIGACMVTAIRYTIRRKLRPLVQQLPYILLGSAIAAVPGTAIVAIVAELMRDMPPDKGLLEYIEDWFQVTFVGTLIGAIAYQRTEYEPAQPTSELSTTETPVSPAATAALPNQCLFHSRLGHTLQHAEIVSLTMQDHYIEVTTDMGTEMVLMRFGDAIDELEGLDGMRIHRSHWVSLPHVQSLTRSGQKAQVLLTDGRSLPVSRTYFGDLDAALSASVNAP